MSLPIGAKAIVVYPHVQHYGKVGTVVPSKRWLHDSVCLQFEGDQRAWLDAGDSYSIDYAVSCVQLVEEVTAGEGGVLGVPSSERTVGVVATQLVLDLR
jgi:hypothetical protein